MRILNPKIDLVREDNNYIHVEATTLLCQADPKLLAQMEGS